MNMRVTRQRPEQAKAGAEFALTGIESDLQSEIAGEITTSQVELADTEERIVAAKDVMRRVEIRSPQGGHCRQYPLAHAWRRRGRWRSHT